MGQARQRGTREQRITQAVRRENKAKVLGFFAKIFTFGMRKRQPSLA